MARTVISVKIRNTLSILRLQIKQRPDSCTSNFKHVYSTTTIIILEAQLRNNTTGPSGYNKDHNG